MCLAETEEVCVKSYFSLKAAGKSESYFAFEQRF